MGKLSPVWTLSSTMGNSFYAPYLGSYESTDLIFARLLNISLKSDKRMERNFLWSSSKGRWKLGSYRMDQRESNTRNSKEFCISKSSMDERWWRLHFSIHCHSKGLFKFTLKYFINFCLVYRSKIRYWTKINWYWSMESWSRCWSNRWCPWWICWSLLWIQVKLEGSLGLP